MSLPQSWILRRHALQDDFGFPIAGGGGDYEAVVTPFVDALRQFRDDVRHAAKDPATQLKDLLVMCDKLRDVTLVDLGVKLKDNEGGAEWQLSGRSGSSPSQRRRIPREAAS